MNYKTYDFCRKDKAVRKRQQEAFVSFHFTDFVVTCIFIFLSSCNPIFSLSNGAVWVFLWYTLSLLITWCAHINQFEYNIAIKRATRFAKKHKKCTVEKGKSFSAEPGEYNLLIGQYLAACFVAVILLIFAIVQQSYSLSNYLVKYKDFCINIFADTYIIAFFMIYKKVFIGEMRLIAGWKDKASYFFHAFGKSKIKNFITHVASLIIIILSLLYYFFNEFSGLFNPFNRRIMGFIYILYMFDTISLIKGLLKKCK